MHLTAGHEYLTQHRYSVDLEHPPLARAVEALPFVRVPEPAGNWVEKGNALLGAGGDYVDGIAKGRRGNLLFLVIGIVAVAGWARERFDWMTATVAAALFSLLPPVLQKISLVNPMFHMIDALRYSYIGRGDAPLGLSLTVVTVLAAAAFAVALRMTATGVKLRT